MEEIKKSNRDRYRELDLELLRTFLGLPVCSKEQDGNKDQIPDVHLDNAIFVSIDFENGDGISSRLKANKLSCKSGQLGVSILEMKDIGRLPPEKALSTYNFAFESSLASQRYLDKKFLFGKTEHIHLPEILPSLKDLVDRGRDIILVGHGVRGDIRILEALGFELESSVVGIFDTGRITDQVLGPSHSPHDKQLRRIFQKVRCLYKCLHVGGNDANFTLRALLLLAVESYRGYYDLLNDQSRERLESIQAIGQAPLPLLLTSAATPAAKEANKAKKAPTCEPRPSARKRVERTREEQEQIRCSRRMKRLRSIDDGLDDSFHMMRTEEVSRDPFDTFWVVDTSWFH